MTTQDQITTLKNYNDKLTTRLSKCKSLNERKNLISLRNLNEGKIQKLTNKLK